MFKTCVMIPQAIENRSEWVKGNDEQIAVDE